MFITTTILYYCDLSCELETVAEAPSVFRQECSTGSSAIHAQVYRQQMPFLIWGFDHNFTNDNIRQTLMVENNILPAM